MEDKAVTAKKFLRFIKGYKGAKLQRISIDTTIAARGGSVN
jgi:hypothetical protein